MLFSFRPVLIEQIYNQRHSNRDLTLFFSFGGVLDIFLYRMYYYIIQRAPHLTLYNVSFQFWRHYNVIERHFFGISSKQSEGAYIKDFEVHVVFSS